MDEEKDFIFDTLTKREKNILKMRFGENVSEEELLVQINKAIEEFNRLPDKEELNSN